MRIRRSSEDTSDLINISSLLDVMFILIIFFMATTTFREEERDIQVNLPETADTQTLSSAQKVIVINVREDGSYLFSDKTVDLGALQDLVVTAVREDPEQRVLIRGDQKALHGTVAAAVAVCRKAGVREANIGYHIPN